MACTDTDGWQNFSGKRCADYDREWCAHGRFVPGAEWTGGEQFNYPEQHCCSCGKGGGSGPAAAVGSDKLLLGPSDPRLVASDFFASQMRDGALAFHRQYDPAFRCGSGAFMQDLPCMAPGARVVVETDADDVVALLRYGGNAGYCAVSCTGTAPSSCYRPGRGRSRRCNNQCAPSLVVDGEVHALAEAARGRYTGDEEVALLRAAGGGEGGGGGRVRRVEVVMPWGAVVALRGLRLTRGGGGAVLARAPAPAPGRTMVFYGDSITQGFCSAATHAFPEEVARLNFWREAREGRRWHAVNMGIAGMRLIASHGTAVGRVGGDLVVTLIGTNDWWSCQEIGGRTSTLVQNIRAVQPHTPLAVVTPLPAWYNGQKKCGGGYTLDQMRAQVVGAVLGLQSRDDKLFLLDGPELLPFALLEDELHPSADGAPHS
jgi:lysophospholipase L1-like esterase